MGAGGRRGSPPPPFKVIWKTYTEFKMITSQCKLFLTLELGFNDYLYILTVKSHAHKPKALLPPLNAFRVRVECDLFGD